MKAVVYDRYGGPERLRVAEVRAPTPGAGQVLVEVVATSVNLSDWEGLRGSPAYARFGGLTRPRRRRRVLGSDLAGRVVAVGPGVTRVAVGDEVYGDNLAQLGGFAELAVAAETALARKPAALSFAQAATLPQPGAIARQAVARARPGDRMLINGGGGGTGMFAIQLAVAAGLHVTAVDGAAKLDFMRSLGAERVIDYREEDFTRAGEWDLVLDVVAQRRVGDYRRALAPGGTCLVAGGRVGTLISLLTYGSAVSATSDARLRVLMVQPGPEWFEPLGLLAAEGAVRINIDRTFPLEQTAAALERVGAGASLGKVVVAVQPEA